MNRKAFLKTVGGSCIALTGLPTLFSGCTTIHSINGVVQNNVLAIRKNEFIESKKGVRNIRKLVVVRANTLAFPIAVFRNEAESYTALWLECTHQGCEINAQQEYLICPCHGSEYDARGKVLNGPAESNLKKFNITTDDEKIYIHLS